MEGCDLTTIFLARYFIEECLISCEMSKYGQNTLACAALYLAQKFRMAEETWSQNLVLETQFNEQDLRKCAKAICLTVRNAQTGTLSAVRKKYARKEYMCISLLPE